MKKLLFNKLLFSLAALLCTLRAGAQATNGSRLFNQYEPELKPLMSCLTPGQYEQFKTHLIAIFDADETFEGDGKPGRFEGGGCAAGTGGKVVQLSHNLGTQASINMYFFLVTDSSVVDLDWDPAGTPLPQGVAQLKRPRMSAVTGDLITITSEGFRRGVGDCCPGYLLTATYGIAGNKLVYHELLSLTAKR